MTTPFLTQYNRSPLDVSPGEYNSGEVITNPTGYLPAHRRIADLFNSGMLLNAFRDFESKAYYDGEFDDDPDSFTPDPTRLKHFDPVDAQRIIEQLQSKKAAASERYRDALVRAEENKQQFERVKETIEETTRVEEPSSE